MDRNSTGTEIFGLESMHQDILSEITSYLDGFAAFALYLTGNRRLILNLENGGLQRYQICFERLHSKLQFPKIVHKFKHLKQLIVGFPEHYSLLPLSEVNFGDLIYTLVELRLHFMNDFESFKISLRDHQFSLLLGDSVNSSDDDEEHISNENEMTSQSSVKEKISPITKIQERRQPWQHLHTLVIGGRHLIDQNTAKLLPRSLRHLEATITCPRYHRMNLTDGVHTIALSLLPPLTYFSARLSAPDMAYSNFYHLDKRPLQDQNFDFPSTLTHLDATTLGSYTFKRFPPYLQTLILQSFNSKSGQVVGNTIPQSVTHLSLGRHCISSPIPISELILQLPKGLKTISLDRRRSGPWFSQNDLIELGKHCPALSFSAIYPVGTKDSDEIHRNYFKSQLSVMPNMRNVIEPFGMDFMSKSANLKLLPRTTQHLTLNSCRYSTFSLLPQTLTSLSLGKLKKSASSDSPTDLPLPPALATFSVPDGFSIHCFKTIPFTLNSLEVGVDFLPYPDSWTLLPPYLRHLRFRTYPVTKRSSQASILIKSFKKNSLVMNSLLELVLEVDSSIKSKRFYKVLSKCCPVLKSLCLHPQDTESLANSFTQFVPNTLLTLRLHSITKLVDADLLALPQSLTELELYASADDSHYQCFLSNEGLKGLPRGLHKFRISQPQKNFTAACTKHLPPFLREFAIVPPPDESAYSDFEAEDAPKHPDFFCDWKESNHCYAVPPELQMQ